ncbi:LysR substrate-binding domain-containing protein [Cobetia sp. MC34]|uniref:LysR substrate-binding domain-containing protein n=1 Tax=Cobetia sp. MC34 TaxID=2785080 RepID=UPI001BCA304C|nr:LysR substrate-binding domain-containing protein [Cobetia sp. MC34]MBS4154266.1 LysR family transcriptional regulator [Cobetia sp. MC34]
MVSPITLDALRVLDAIERRGSFAAAAETLHRVPSAISYSVQKLEEELGVPLFDRSRRKAELTDAGHLVLAHGRRILLATEEMTALARQAGAGWEVELRICVDTILDPDALYPLLEQFQAIQPRTRVVLSEEVMAGAWDALHDNRCDLVIGAPGEPPVSGLACRRFGAIESVFAVAADHPLTRLAQPIAFEALQEYPTVIVADSSRSLPGHSSGLLDGRSQIIVKTTAQKIEVQRKGLGVGYLPRHRIHLQLEEGSLALLQLETQRAPIDLSLAWRSGRQGKALKWFLERLAAPGMGEAFGLLPREAATDLRGD